MLCGNKTGQSDQVTGNYVMLKFHSDDSDHKRGFLIHFIAIPVREYHTFLILLTQETDRSTCTSLD